MYKGNARNGEIEIIKQIAVFENESMIVHNDIVKMPDSQTGYFPRIVDKAEYKVVVNVVSHSRLLLLKMFDHTTRSWRWRVPTIEARTNSTPESDALACINQVAGYASDELVKLCTIGQNNTPVYFFSAHLPVQCESSKDPNLCIKASQFFDANELDELLRTGELDPLTALATYSFFNQTNATGDQPDPSTGQNIDHQLFDSQILIENKLLSDTISMDPLAQRKWAYSMGVKAKLSGKSKHFNPFRNRTCEHNLESVWKKGWMDAD
ncbi:hypothetical protein [Vibrio owensii]|uniref:hypothetical protein n=1 Tax=Vibrio owensii TaxID=696485 RepID=UPI0018F26649|nr:hypothetical protein [Vibrio owensii]